MTNKKYFACAGAEPYFTLVRKALRDLVDGEHYRRDSAGRMALARMFLICSYSQVGNVGSPAADSRDVFRRLFGAPPGVGRSSGSATRMTGSVNFPYELVETSGENALDTWEELKKAGRGAPVVLGHDLENRLTPLGVADWNRMKPIKEILAAADAMSFPEALFKLRKDEWGMGSAAIESIDFPGDFGNEEDGPPVGESPVENSSSSGLSVAYDILTGEPRSSMRIALIPTNDPTTIPAHLRWGHWNECPPPAYHIAALRAWRDIYGAELIGLGFDVMNLRVSRKPATRKEALELAHVQYIYCSDIINQGYGSHCALASALMGDDWWSFWWD